jgi:lactoylglutathione lyase
MSNDPPVPAGPRHLVVTELRLVITADEYDEVLAFYRDVLGLPELADFSSANGRVRLLDAGRATVEVVDNAQAAYIDEVEVGRRVAGHIRVALEVDDTSVATRRLSGARAQVLSEPTVTPWRSLNARLQAPDGLQLTLFAELPPDGQEYDSRPDEQPG